MIITSEIEVCATGKLIKHLKEKGYDVAPNQKISIKVTDLPHNTRKRVTVKCDICEKEQVIMYKNYLLNISKEGYYSCNKCKGNKYIKTCVEKYGVENISQLESIKEQKKETLKNNYGVTNILELNKDTIKEKYGVENIFQSEEIKNKIKETNLKKYGAENPQQCKEIWDKTRKTCLEKYGFEYASQNQDVKNKVLIKNHTKTIERLKEFNIVSVDENNLFNLKCDNGEDHIFKIDNNLLYNRKNLKTILCTICNPINSYSTSGLELQLFKFIKENYNGKIIENSRKIIPPYELDIYLPELNLAFEFNGVYWHNEIYKDKNYHFNKYLLCKNKGIQLIQIYEDDWNIRQDIVKSMILNRLNKTINKILARKCKIDKINNNDLVKNFLDQNHIQGYVQSSVKIGLFYNDKLVSLMCFKQAENNFELNRFCNILYTNVVGGASKLFTFFKKNYDYNQIISFSNNDYSNGNLYFKLGFKKDKELKPDYSYLVDDIRKHKFNFRKKCLEKSFETKNKTEHEICLENRIYRIYDSGKIKFVF